jgi:hypothetical protein
MRKYSSDIHQGNKEAQQHGPRQFFRYEQIPSPHFAAEKAL